MDQLDKTRTGAACQCECHSRDLPLTPVNAAKAEFIKRPYCPSGPTHGARQRSVAVSPFVALELPASLGPEPSA